MKKCPYCGEEILDIAKKCKHCGEWLNKDCNKNNTNGYLPGFNRMSTVEFFMISWFTSGLYVYYWYFKNLKVFKNLTGRDNGKTAYLISYIICSVFAIILSGIMALTMPQKSDYLIDYGLNDYQTYYKDAMMQYFSSGEWVIPLLLILLSCFLGVIFFLILNYRLLKDIEEYAYKTTNKVIKHNGFAWFFFGALYVNFAINSYKERLGTCNHE